MAKKIIIVFSVVLIIGLFAISLNIPPTLGYNSAINFVQKNCNAKSIDDITTKDSINYFIRFYPSVLGNSFDQTAKTFNAINAQYYLFFEATGNYPDQRSTSNNLNCWMLLMIDQQGKGSLSYEKTNGRISKLFVSNYPVENILNTNTERILYWPTGKELISKDCNESPVTESQIEARKRALRLYTTLGPISLENDRFIGPKDMTIDAQLLLVNNRPTCLVTWLGDDLGHGTVAYESKSGIIKTIKVNNYINPYINKGLNE